MTDSVARLAAAEVEAAAARERLTATLTEAQHRLSPKRLAKKATRDAAEKGEAMAQTGLDQIRRNPGVVAGAVALAGLFLGRHRLAGLVRRARGETTN